jgi:site-specific DNA recombinase
VNECAGVYVRISDDREGRELGVQRQEEDSAKLAKLHGLRVYKVYRDNDIGASTRSRKDRPAYREMLDDARSGRIRVILAYTSSRLTRRPLEHEELINLSEENGVRFLYVASPAFDLNTSAGRLVARILAAADAGEAENISERVRRAHLSKAEKGIWRGGRRPFGYEADGVTVIPAEAALIRHCCSQLLAGQGQTLHSLTAEANAAKIPTSTGGIWRPPALRAMLLRPRNAGLMTYQGEVAGVAQWESIVPEETWRAVCTLLTDPSRFAGAVAVKRHLGSGLYQCGVCADGTTVRSSSTRGPGPKGGYNPVRAYRCRAAGHLVRQAEPVDALVQRFVVARLLEPDAGDLVQPPGGVDLTALHEQAKATRVRMWELDDELDDGEITKADHRRRTARLSTRLEEIESTLASQATGSVLDGLAGNPDAARIWYGQREDGSDGLPLARRAAVISALASVSLLRAPRGRMVNGSYFDPKSVEVTWK